MAGYIIEIQGSKDSLNRVEVFRGGKSIADLGCSTKDAKQATVLVLVPGQPVAVFPTWHLANAVGTAALWPGQQVKISPASSEIVAKGKAVDLEPGDAMRSPSHAGTTITIMDQDELPTMMPMSRPPTG